jgi:hypothetical protein
MAKSPEASESGSTSISESKSKAEGPINFTGGIGAIVIACVWLVLYVTAIAHSLMLNNQNSTSTKNVEAIAAPTTAATKEARDRMRVLDEQPQR